MWNWSDFGKHRRRTQISGHKQCSQNNRLFIRGKNYIKKVFKTVESLIALYIEKSREFGVSVSSSAALGMVCKGLHHFVVKTIE